jgi:hypothetical protein
VLLGFGLLAILPREEAPAMGPVAEPSGAAAARSQGDRDGMPAVPEPDAGLHTRREEGLAATLPPQSDLQGRFLSARDLTPLFEEMLARARSGDAEAAYYAYRIQQACSYREPDDPRSAQQALADFDQEYARFAAPGVGFAGDWRLQERRAGIERAWQACPPGLLQLLARHADAELLADAAGLGHPLSQAMLASELLRNDRDGTERDAAFSNMRKAARSRDPDVLFEIGRAVALASRSADDEDFRQANAWRLVACWHGLECGPDNPYIQQALCGRPGSPRCIPGAGLEHYMRSWDPGGFAETYALADQIMQAMNDGRWDDLRF